MEETVPTIHISMVRCNIFFMTENDEIFYAGFHGVPVLAAGTRGVAADRAIRHD